VGPGRSTCQAGRDGRRRLSRHRAAVRRHVGCLGYIFFVEQGNAKFGEVVPDLTFLVPFTTPDGINWVGYGLPGDSGSGVMNDAGLAVGDLTHGIGVAGLPVPGLSFGTDMQGISNLIGSSYKLVTLDGRAASCANPLGT
jgi:hypothetical protein